MTPPLEFQGFPNLEDLCLQYIDFEANSSGTVINLPQLKSLSLYKCINANNFNIKATKLQALHVTDCPDVTSLRLFHSQCLTSLFLYCSKPTDGSAQFDKMVLHKMLSNVPSLTYFFTNGYFLKFYIAEYVPSLSPCTLNSLKYLGLLNINFGDLVQLRAALCMLRNFPSLETLSVRNEQMGLGDVHFDTKPASYCMDQPLKRLQTIKIAFIEGSQPELLFVKVLLDHSPALKKMRITLGTTIDAHKRLSFANNVMGFQRASEKVEILVDTIPIATKFPQLQ